MRAGVRRMTNNPELDEAMKAVLALIQEFRLCDEATEKLFGCSAAQLAVLAAISRKGTVSVQSLATELHLHQSSASAVARDLAKNGLLRRRQAKNDRRNSELSLTRKGQALGTKAGPTGRPLLQAALSTLPETITQELVRSTSRLGQEMIAQRTKHTSGRTGSPRSTS